MKAVGYYHPQPISAADALLDIEVSKPQLQPRDLLVRIEAISVNPVDVKTRANSPPSNEAPRILGYDAAGVVEAIGSEASLYKPGDPVFYAGALDRPGTNSEWHAVDERLVGRRPSNLTAEQAAALPLTTLTAWELLFDRLSVARMSGEQHDAMLIINGAGGVGSILTQLASRLTNLTVIATASRPETIAWVQAMGAHHVINHHQALDDALKSVGLSEVRFVAGLTATAQHQKSIVQVLAPQGALAMIDDPASFDIVPFKRKSASVHWEFMFTRSFYQTPDMEEQGRILNEVSALVEEGVVQTTLRKHFGSINARNLKRAHEAVESGSGLGKIVLSGFED